MRWGKPIKNKKRIDPRYFLNEKAAKRKVARQDWHMYDSEFYRVFDANGVAWYREPDGTYINKFGQIAKAFERHVDEDVEETTVILYTGVQGGDDYKPIGHARPFDPGDDPKWRLGVISAQKADFPSWKEPAGDLHLNPLKNFEVLNAVPAAEPVVEPAAVPAAPAKEPPNDGLQDDGEGN